MKPCKTSWQGQSKEGYYIVNPSSHDGYYKLHRYLYAKHHKIRLTSKDIVRHLCNNCACIEITHLALGTVKDNVADLRSIGGHNNQQWSGNNHPMAKITEEDAKEVKRLYKKTDLTQEQIGKRFGIHISTVSKIVNGKWRC